MPGGHIYVYNDCTGFVLTMGDASILMLCYLTYTLKVSFITLRFWFFLGGEVDFLSRRVMGACNQEIADQLSPLLNHVEFERD